MGGSATVGWRPNLQSQVSDAASTAARQDSSWEHQEACLEVLPAEDRASPLGATPELDEKEAHLPVLVVPIPNANEGTLPHGVPGVEEQHQTLWAEGTKKTGRWKNRWKVRGPLADER
jgi:hypothetical protein